MNVGIDRVDYAFDGFQIVVEQFFDRDIFNGSLRDLDFDIPFELITTIEKRDEETCRVSLASGRTLDLNDSHDWAVIGFAIVGNEAGFINSKVDKVFNFADEMGLAMIADTHMEIIHL